MRKYFIPLMLLLMLDSCAMNTQFSCDATAGDKCLNVEEVDNLSKQGLTLENMPSNINPSQIASIPTEAPREAGMGPERIWIAPYTDAAGVAHEGSFVVINFPMDKINLSHLSSTRVRFKIKSRPVYWDRSKSSFPPFYFL